jgi:hypothetical protein
MGTTILASANLFWTAKSTRSAWISAMTTVFAPHTLAIAAQRSPTAPAPKISTVLPGLRAALLEPWIATPRGSRMAPRSRETLDGNLIQSVLIIAPKSSATYLWQYTAGWLILSCRVPWKWGNDFAELLNLKDLQILYLPSLHKSHARHGKPTSRATRSPTLRLVTCEPTAVTTPDDSWPSVKGSWTIISPLR